MHRSGGQQSRLSTQLTNLWRCVQLHSEPPLFEGVRQRLEFFLRPHTGFGHGLVSFQRSCRRLTIDMV